MKKYDLALTWQSSKEEKFVKWIKKETLMKGMKFLLISNDNVVKVTNEVEKGQTRIFFLLDNEANYGDKKDPFARLCYAVKDTEGLVICDPDHARQGADIVFTRIDQHDRPVSMAVHHLL